jgi:hypothetical protein
MWDVHKPTLLVAYRQYLALALADFQTSDSLDYKVIASQGERFLLHMQCRLLRKAELRIRAEWGSKSCERCHFDLCAVEIVRRLCASNFVVMAR